MLMLPKAALLLPPLVVAESSYQGVGSSALGEFLVQAAAALVLLLVIWNIVEKLRGTPQKRQVTVTSDFATQKEHAELKAEVTKIDNERRTSVAKLHEKIDGNTTITAETRGEVRLMNQQMHQLLTHLLNQSKK
jgi:uncharacterized membrane protein YhiD involved in acid resistance